MMKVYHVRGILVRLVHTNPERLRYPQDYLLVAEVPYEEKESVEINLENAYRLTNSYNDAWYTNSDLMVHKQARSTSVGDIVVLPDGNVWQLTHAGFKFIESAENTKNKAEEYRKRQAEIEKEM